MTKTLKTILSERRRLLGNPYAYIEYLDAPDIPSIAVPHLTSSIPDISESRQLLQNPYAYLNGSGKYSAFSLGANDRHDSNVQAHSNVPTRYSNRDIEERVQNLHIRLWKERESLWGGTLPSDPIEILDPATALRLIGYQYEIADGLGQYRSDGGLIEVAGLIDRTNKTVRISGQFPLSVCTFTAAHELGHALLHHAGGGVHRDRPMDGAAFSRDRIELEADKFATYFLMPAKLVRARFSRFFGTENFVLGEETSFALSGKSFTELQKKCPSLRDLTRLLASTEKYNGQHFISLASQFRVSTEAMAIRLEELGIAK